MSKILLIGGLGYIGSVIYEMYSPYYDITIMDNNMYRFNTDISYINGDIRNKEFLDNLIPKYDIIINAASIVGDPACLLSIPIATEVNYFGVKNLVEICNRYNKYIVHLSTCSVYGSKFNCILKEEEVGFPIDFYGQLKYTQEKLLTDQHPNNHLIVRLGTVYGLSPRMRYDLVINLFVAQSIKDKKITVFGGTQERPFIHVKDVARSIFHLINLEKKGTYNITGKNISIINIAKEIININDCEIVIRQDIIDKRNYNINCEKLLDTGFKYEFSIKSAIDEISKSDTAMNYSSDIFSDDKLLRRILIKFDTEPKIFECGKFIDDRGSLTFSNCFPENIYSNIKRFYQVENFSTDIIRAFHGHKYEAKYVYVPVGTLFIILIKMIESENNMILDKTSMKKYILSSKSPSILYIPPEYANGFRSLEQNTITIFYSTATTEESKVDDYRFDYDIFGKEIWEVKNR